MRILWGRKLKTSRVGLEKVEVEVIQEIMVVGIIMVLLAVRKWCRMVVILDLEREFIKEVSCLDLDKT